MYFRLFPYCKFIKTDVNACIYNLSNGHIIELNQDYSEFLENCEINSKELSEENHLIAEDLSAKEFGRIVENSLYVEDLYVGFKPEPDHSEPSNNFITTLILQVTNECNLNCIFCEIPAKFTRKTGCSRSCGPISSLTFNQSKRAIEQALKLGARRLILLGGEPLLESKKLMDIITVAKAKGFHEVVVFTNGSLLNQEIITFFKETNTILNIQVLSLAQEVINRVSRGDMNIDILEKNISRLKDIRYYVTLLIGEFNENDADLTESKLKQIHSNMKINREYIYPGKKQDFSVNNKKLLSEPCFQKMSIVTYAENRKTHTCFGDSISITADGEIQACIMDKSTSLGNISDRTIAQVLSDEEHAKYKYLTKDKITPCSDCSFRYGCFDCRAIQQSVDTMRYCKIADRINNRVGSTSI